MIGHFLGLLWSMYQGLNWYIYEWVPLTLFKYLNKKWSNLAIKKRLPKFHLWFNLNYLYYLGSLKQDYSHQKKRKSLSLIDVMRKYLQLKDTINNSWLYDRPPKQNTLQKTSFVYFLSKKLSCKLFNTSTPPPSLVVSEKWSISRSNLC